jgi:hypothetical protein
LLNPVHVGGPNVEDALESARIPLYLGGENYGRLRAILDYDAWNTIQDRSAFSQGDGTLRQSVEQNVPLRYPLHRAFYADDSVALTGENDLDEHYTLYLEDAGW